MLPVVVPPVAAVVPPVAVVVPPVVVLPLDVLEPPAVVSPVTVVVPRVTVIGGVMELTLSSWQMRFSVGIDEVLNLWLLQWVNNVYVRSVRKILFSDAHSGVCS